LPLALVYTLVHSCANVLVEFTAIVGLAGAGRAAVSLAAILRTGFVFGWIWRVMALFGWFVAMAVVTRCLFEKPSQFGFLFQSVFLSETRHIPGVIAAFGVDVKVGATRCADLDAKGAFSCGATPSVEPGA